LARVPDRRRAGARLLLPEVRGAGVQRRL